MAGGTTSIATPNWPCGHPRTAENTQSVGTTISPRCKECRRAIARRHGVKRRAAQRAALEQASQQRAQNISNGAGVTHYGGGQ